MDAHIYASELEHMALAMAEYPHLETGGSLFGLWTHTGKPPPIGGARGGLIV